MTETDLLEYSLIEQFRRAGTGHWIESPEWTLVADRGSSRYGTNYVFRANLSAHAADAAIGSTLQFFQSAGVIPSWFLSPSSRPLDLGWRLQRQGLIRLDSVTGMVTDPTTFESGQPTGISVRPMAAGEEHICATIELSSDAPPDDDWDACHADLRRSFEPRSDFETVVAQLDGQPVGFASLLYLEESAQFTGAVVLPEFRRRGVYRKLIEERMGLVRGRGLSLVTVHALTRTSEPICRELGFRPVCEFPLYGFPQVEE